MRCALKELEWWGVTLGGPLSLDQAGKTSLYGDCVRVRASGSPAPAAPPAPPRSLPTLPFTLCCSPPGSAPEGPTPGRLFTASVRIALCFPVSEGDAHSCLCYHDLQQAVNFCRTPRFTYPVSPACSPVLHVVGTQKGGLSTYLVLFFSNSCLGHPSQYLYSWTSQR